MDQLLYRIIKGRLSYKVGDLNLYIESPVSDIMADSYEIYEETYNSNYMNETLTLEEMNQLILEYGVWSEKEELYIQSLESQLDKLKLEAFRVYFDSSRLSTVKSSIEKNEKAQLQMLMKKNQLTHMTCESIATQAQWLWIIEHSTFCAAKKTKYDWSVISPRHAMNFYDDNSISSKEIRSIARSNTWRQMWVVGKKIGNLFNRSSIDMTKEQLTLCSFSVMYDNVYDSVDCPNDKIIQDDDCLDGWFIDQKNKSEESKKQNKANSIASKLNNADEIYIVAQSPEHAKHINDMNTNTAKKIKESRKDLINKKGVIFGDSDFNKIKEKYNG